MEYLLNKQRYNIHRKSQVNQKRKIYINCTIYSIQKRAKIFLYLISQRNQFNIISYKQAISEKSSSGASRDCFNIENNIFIYNSLWCWKIHTTYNIHKLGLCKCGTSWTPERQSYCSRSSLVFTVGKSYYPNNSHPFNPVITGFKKRKLFTQEIYWSIILKQPLLTKPDQWGKKVSRTIVKLLLD